MWKITTKKLITNMEKKGKTPILEQVIKKLQRISRKKGSFSMLDKALFWLVLAHALYLAYCFIYWVIIASSMDRNEFIHAYKVALIFEVVAMIIAIIRILSILSTRREIQMAKSLSLFELRTLLKSRTYPLTYVSLSLSEKDTQDRKLISRIFPDMKGNDMKAYGIIEFSMRIADNRSLIGLSKLIGFKSDPESLKRALVLEVRTLGKAKRKQYLQELSAFEEFFANLS